MNQEQAARLLQAGQEMRKAQKRHEKTRNCHDNRWRVGAEGIFDKLLQECVQGAQQGNLLTISHKGQRP